MLGTFGEEEETNNIFTFIESNFGRTLNSIEYEIISNWEDNELTRYAIKQAVLNQAYSVKYIDTILENYKIKGIKTVVDAQITTASAELEEVNAYMESLQSMLSSNIQEDFDYSLS